MSDSDLIELFLWFIWIWIWIDLHYYPMIFKIRSLSLPLTVCVCVVVCVWDDAAEWICEPFKYKSSLCDTTAKRFSPNPPITNWNFISLNLLLFLFVVVAVVQQQHKNTCELSLSPLHGTTIKKNENKKPKIGQHAELKYYYCYYGFEWVCMSVLLCVRFILFRLVKVSMVWECGLIKIIISNLFCLRSPNSWFIRRHK